MNIKNCNCMNCEKGYFWPTPEQELLLKAAILQGDDAIEAWKNWAAAINFDLLDSGSQRLLPLLYRNLVNQNIHHPVLDVYKGFYRMTWYKNRLLCHKIVDVLRLLESHGIQPLLMKGAVLADVYYGDWALRPMNDFDLLVPEEDALKIVDLLCSSGWKPAAAMPDESDLKTTHACTLVDSSGIEFDLHWRILHESGLKEMDHHFKSAAMHINFSGMKVSVLSHTDQLFHILIHGARWNAIAPLRWIPDAVMILRKSESSIDWDRMINESRRRCLVLPLKNTLLYIHEVFKAPVPAETISKLIQMKPLLSERLEFHMQGRPRGIIRDIIYLWFTHVRTSGTPETIKLVFEFPSFLRKFWKVPPDKGMTGFLIWRLAKKLRESLRTPEGLGRAV